MRSLFRRSALLIVPCGLRHQDSHLERTGRSTRSIQLAYLEEMVGDRTWPSYKFRLFNEWNYHIRSPRGHQQRIRYYQYDISSFLLAYYFLGLGGCTVPAFLVPIMEDFGIRPVLLSTYLVFVCLLIPVGFAHNYATLVVVRFFSGGCVPLMSDAVASIASNVFHGDQARSIPISLYVTVYLASTSIGPVVGASILQYLPWRWIGYMEVIWTAALFPILGIGLPESRGSAILLARAKRLRAEGKKAYTAAELGRTPLYRLVVKSMQRPLYMLCTESVVLVAALWAAFSLGTIYLFTQSAEQVYIELYGWDDVQAGYVQVAIVVGEILGCALCISTNHWYYESPRE